MTVGGDTHRFEPSSGAFTVIDADGRTVEVRVTEKTQFGPTETRKGRWGDVVDDPLAADERLAVHAPGDHVEVELSGVVIAPGDHVTVEGTAEYRREGGGYRDNGEHVPTLLHARHVAVGAGGAGWLAELEAARNAKARERAQWEEEYQRKQAEEARERNRGRERPITGSVILLVLALAGLSVPGMLVAFDPSWAIGARYWFFNGLPLGVLFAGAALFVWNRRRLFIRMVVASRTTESGLPWELRAAPMAYAVGVLVQVVFVGPFVSMGSGTNGFASLASLVTLPVVIIAIQWRWLASNDGGGVDVLRRLAMCAGGVGHDWADRTGRVEQGGVARTCVYSLTTSGLHVGGGVQAGLVDWCGELSGGSGRLSVRVGERLVDVFIEGTACWGTTRRFAEVRSRTKAVLTESIEAGDEVVVLGRVTEGEMRAGGPESLMLFASHRGPARSAVRRALWKHRFGMLAHALLIVIAIGFAALTVWAG